MSVHDEEENTQAPIRTPVTGHTALAGIRISVSAGHKHVAAQSQAGRSPVLSPFLLSIDMPGQGAVLTK